MARSRPSIAGVVPALTGLAALVLGATTVFAQLQQSLNRIWGVAGRPRRFAIVDLIRTRLLSLALIVAIGFVLLVSLLISVAVHGVIRYASSRMTVPVIALDAVELVLSLFVISALFAMVFKMLPDVELDWKDVRLGAVITAALFILGRYLIAAYLAYTAPDSPYGAAGALVLLLLWVYYSSLILFFGAALTKARLMALNRSIVPKATAVRVTEELIDLERPASG